MYADDCDFIAHSVQDMQHLMDNFTKARAAVGLTISLKKTVVMYQPAPGKLYHGPNIYVYGKRLQEVDKFVYLGSTLYRSCNFDSEVSLRIQKASKSFGKLEKRLWCQHGILKETKLKVYHACVLSSLLYACESWVVYRHHFRQLERFHQQCLRRILSIHWTMYVSDVEVLEWSHCDSIEAMVLKSR